MALENWTLDQIIGQLDSGYKLGVASGGTITWGTPVNWHDYNGYYENSGLSGLNAQQKSVAAQTLSMWSDVANINFQYVGNTVNADIKLQNTSETEGSYAWAYLPDIFYGTYEDYNSSIWFATGYDLQKPSLTSADKGGGWAFMAFIHEIGHALIACTGGPVPTSLMAAQAMTLTTSTAAATASRRLKSKAPTRFLPPSPLQLP